MMQTTYVRLSKSHWSVRMSMVVGSWCSGLWDRREGEEGCRMVVWLWYVLKAN
jgi:hypothetical protein